ncbi:hypothetical protein BZM27_09430 [Paraburkholderia steynii]|uniref:Uncharacterized protein n=1 Tax=Paraburkholderia steynii TaxID=1245441 RepID=A0A4R0XHU4_9BURK|nr:hypothetical protein BZM27_09430 [Paraburkholderia steynii]
MSVTCQQLVQAAENFNKVASCEADWRGVCNRSYYGVYHDAKAFWESLSAAGFPGTLSPTSKGGRHTDLCERLANPDAPKTDPRRKQSRQIGAIMQNLLADRIKSDYYPNEDVDAVAAANSVTGAKNVLLLLSGQQIGAPLQKFSGALSTPPANPQPQAPQPAQPASRSSFFKVVK